TLYRWVGEREQLLGTILGALSDEWLALVEPKAKGEGTEWFLDVLRRHLEHAAASEPLTTFAEREPALALRLLLDRDGSVVEHTGGAVRRLLATAHPGYEAPDETVRVIVAVSVSLVWGNIATGQAPDIDDVISVARTVLSALPVQV